MPPAGLIVLGFLVGTVGALIGAGGGFVLMPALLVMYPERAPEVLTGLSLAMVSCNALSGTVAYARAGRVNYRAGVALAVATIPGATLGAITTAALARQAFETVFGVVLVLFGVFIGLRGPRSAPLLPPAVRPALGLGVAISMATGYFSTLLGIGGGIVYTPTLMYAMRFPVHYATATSNFVLTITAFTATLTHWATGSLSGVYTEVLCLAAGGIVGGQAGAALSSRDRGAWLLRVLGIALVLAGVRILA